MIIARDEIESFIPDRKPSLVILGTMCSICARTFDGQRPDDAFFYHSNRNHFWKVIQLLFESRLEPKKLTVDEKKAFLNKHRIAVSNLVQEIVVKKSDQDDPSDTILFQSHKRGSLKFKAATKEFKTVLQSTPLFFTCRSKKGIQILVNDYLNFNGLNADLAGKIWYLPTPTRCNPRDRSLLWKREINAHRTDLAR